MFKLLKIFFYAVVIFVIWFLYWFLPKYSFVQKNPGYCVNLTKNLYYCGSNAGLNKVFGEGK
jgi:hypothetical protein